MKKLIVLCLLLAVSMFICISCEQESQKEYRASGGSGEVKYTTVMFKPVVMQVKSISQTNSTVPTAFRYKAEPMFEKSDSEIFYGETSGFESLAKDTQSGYYSGTNKFVQGKWTFTVEGLVGDVVLYRGSVNVILNSSNQVVSIDLPGCFDSLKNGTVTVSFSVPRLSESEAGVFSVNLFDAEYQALSSPSSISITPDYSSDTVVTGTGSASLPEGMYILEVSYSDNGASVGPAQTAFIVKEGMITTVSGSVENSELVSTSFALNYLKGSITRSSEKTNGKYVYTFNAEGGVSPTNCIWFVNGTRQDSTSNQMSWDSSVSGIYYITCIALRKSGATVLDVFSTTKTETR